MADRWQVKYEEVQDQYPGDVPARSYFSHMIDVILININERDSINTIASDPAHNTNKDYQLGGIKDKAVETALNNAKTRVNNTNEPLYAADVNTIITNVEDLATTMVKPTTATRVVSCDYVTPTYMVPSSWTPSQAGGDVQSVEITINHREATSGDEYKTVMSGFTSLASDYIQEITRVNEDDITAFGRLSPTLVNISATETVNIIGFFGVYDQDKDDTGADLVNQRTIIVFDQPVEDFSELFNGGSFVIGETTVEFTMLNLKNTNDNLLCYAEVETVVPELFVDDETVDNIDVSMAFNDEMAVAQEFNSCGNIGIECTNRRRIYGYRLIQTTEPDYVWSCTNSQRTETYTITSGSKVTITKVNPDEVVYASTFTTLAKYLRQVSQALDGYKDWWGSNGYCVRKCQTSCQATCQLSCQSCYSNTCHNQNCGLS